MKSFVYVKRYKIGFNENIKYSSMRLILPFFPCLLSGDHQSVQTSGFTSSSKEGPCLGCHTTLQTSKALCAMDQRSTSHTSPLWWYSSRGWRRDRGGKCHYGTQPLSTGLLLKACKQALITIPLARVFLWPRENMRLWATRTDEKSVKSQSIISQSIISL